MNKNINSLNVVNTNKIIQTKALVKDYSNNIKFYEINTYPNIKDREKLKNFLGKWSESLTYIYNNLLDSNIIYSLGVLGVRLSNGEIITYGPHILISKDLNLEQLIIYVEGQIDQKITSLESGWVVDDEEDPDDIVVIFKWRKISIMNNKEIYNLSNQLKIVNENIKKVNSTGFKLNNSKLNRFIRVIPLSCRLTDFGKLIKDSFKNEEGKMGKLFQYSHEITINILEEGESGYIGVVYKKGQEYFKFKDKEIIKVKNTFQRIIGNNILHIENGEIIKLETIINSKLIQPAKRDIIKNNNIGTFDFECYLDDKNEFKVFVCWWSTAKESKSYYLLDYPNSESMMDNFVNDLINKYPGFTFYGHNMGKFDINFLLKFLHRNLNIKFSFRDGKILSVAGSKTILNQKGKKIKKLLTFKDSYLILPSSLDNLLKTFKVGVNKTIFPYKFPKINNLNYIGEVPDYNYFDKKKVSLENYLNYKNNFERDKIWNLRDEVLKYSYNDVIGLFKVIEIFQNDIFKLESINLTRFSSISSTTLNIFLANYYNVKETPLYIPKKRQYSDIKQAYFGGRVEVFNCYGENLYWYDVVSLYPSQMKNDLPIGNLIKSTDTNLDNYFGFVYASVEYPENVNIPILPFRDEDRNIYYPVGNWTGWFPSVVLKKAVKLHNVKYKIHYGYKLEKSKNIFSKFVDTFFNLKQKAENKGKRFIYKLFLNSNYGRWGLNYENTKTEIIKTEKIKDIFLNHVVLDNDIFDIKNDLEYIKYKIEPKDSLKDLDFDKFLTMKDQEQDFVIRCVPLAAMISGQSHAFMSDFYDLDNNDCYYTDTDSLILKKPLPDNVVGSELGKFEFKGKVKKAYFISPKLYCLIMETGETIIKAKGIPKNMLTEEDFKLLLLGIEKEIPNEKFFSNLKKSTVYLKQLSTTISPGLLKRHSIYEQGVIIGTKPLKVVNGILIEKGKIKKPILSIVPYSYYNRSIIKYSDI